MNLIGLKHQHENKTQIMQKKLILDSYQNLSTVNDKSVVQRYETKENYEQKEIENYYERI